MKKSQIFIAAAFVLAIGSAFTSKSHSPTLQGYATGACSTPVDIPTDCALTGNNVCTSGTTTYYKTSGCSDEFRKP